MNAAANQPGDEAAQLGFVDLAMAIHGSQQGNEDSLQLHRSTQDTRPGAVA
jgi:hypothetical protein